MIRQAVLDKWRRKEPSPTYAKLLAILVKGDWKDAQDYIVKLSVKK